MCTSQPLQYRREKQTNPLLYCSGTAFSPFLPLHPSQYSCGFLVIICSLLRAVGRREHRALLTGLPEVGISFWPMSCFYWNKPGGSFLKFLSFMCFLTGVYAICCCRNHVVETKVEDGPTKAYGKGRASFRQQEPKRSSSSAELLPLCWPG